MSRHGGRGLLVLWDVDHTLIDSGGAGAQLYRLVFRDLFGRDLPAIPAVAGRTERAIVPDLLALAGIGDPGRHVDDFLAGLAAAAPVVAELAAAQGRVLPGAAAALAAVAASLGTVAVQSVLTGNLRAVAETKLAAFGLDGRLDLTIGTYGDISGDRAELVPLARRAAARAYGGDFAGAASVLIGDTPLDVAAALASGARCVGVATGRSSVDDLSAAGAHVVLPDLTDTAALVAAIAGAPRSGEPGDSHAGQEFRGELVRELSPGASMRARWDAGGGC